MKRLTIDKRTTSWQLADKVREISGENINACMQCGTCSAVCPMFEQTGSPPRLVLALAQLGLEERLADERIYSACASCLYCGVRCPRGIDVPRVMEALRQITLRTNVDLVNPGRIPREDMHELPTIALVAAFRKLTA